MFLGLDLFALKLSDGFAVMHNILSGSDRGVYKFRGFLICLSFDYLFVDGLMI